VASSSSPIVSGDGDFKSLVKHLQARGVRVEGMAFGRSTARELKDTVNNFIDLDDNSDRYLIDDKT